MSSIGKSTRDKADKRLTEAREGLDNMCLLIAMGSLLGVMKMAWKQTVMRAAQVCEYTKSK